MPQIQHIAVNSISGQESIPGLSAFRTVHISEGSKNEPEAVRRTANALLEIKQSWLRNSFNSSGNNYEWNELLHILNLYGFPLGDHQDGTSNKHLYDLAEFSIRGGMPRLVELLSAIQSISLQRINKFIIKSYQALNNDNIKWKNRSELLAVTIGSKLQDGLTKKIAWDISTDARVEREVAARQQLELQLNLANARLKDFEGMKRELDKERLKTKKTAQLMEFERNERKRAEDELQNTRKQFKSSRRTSWELDNTPIGIPVIKRKKKLVSSVPSESPHPNHKPSRFSLFDASSSSAIPTDLSRRASAGAVLTNNEAVVLNEFVNFVPTKIADEISEGSFESMLSSSTNRQDKDQKISPPSASISSPSTSSGTESDDDQEEEDEDEVSVTSIDAPNKSPKTIHPSHTELPSPSPRRKLKPLKDDKGEIQEIKTKYRNSFVCGSEDSNYFEQANRNSTDSSRSFEPSPVPASSNIASNIIDDNKAKSLKQQSGIPLSGSDLTRNNEKAKQTWWDKVKKVKKEKGI